MGNENEIKELLEVSKAEFLPQEFEDPEGAIDVYSLDEEFAKTKKNKNFVFAGFVFLFLAAVVITGVVITYNIQQRGKENKINIDDFSDVHVQEVISQNKNLEIELDTLKSELDELYEQLKNEIEEIRSNFAAKKDNIYARALTDDERKVELAKLNTELNSKLSVTRRRYAVKIKDKKERISILESKITENQEEIKGSEGKEAVLSSQDLLQSIQINRIKEYYEKKIERLNSQHKREIERLERKYNPVFREQELQAVIKRSAYRVDTPGIYLKGVEPDLRKERIYTTAKIERLRTIINLQIALIERMQKIPYKNSVQRTLIHLESLSKDISTQYDNLVKSLVYIDRRNDIRIGNFNFAFDYKLQSDSENGYILDIRNSARLGVYINRVHDIKSGDVALVFRQDDEYIGTIRFIFINGMLFAETVETAPGRKIQPFDKVLLKIVEVEK